MLPTSSAVQVNNFLFREGRAWDQVTNFLSLPSLPTSQADQEDEMPGTLQGKESPQGSFITEPWTQKRSGHAKHLQTGPICVVSSAVMGTVAEPHVQDGPYPVIQEPVLWKQLSKTDYSGSTQVSGTLLSFMFSKMVWGFMYKQPLKAFEGLVVLFLKTQ